MSKWFIKGLTALFIVITQGACTLQLKDTFRYQQQVQTFATQLDVNTKIDLLWVIDNSSSMDVEQTKLRQGLANFANSYLKPYWDIRIGVITTDTYLANPRFDTYVTSNLTLSPGVPEFVQPAHMKSLILGRIAAIGAGNVATDPVLQKLAPYFTISSDPTQAGKLYTDGSGNPVLKLGAIAPVWLQRANYAKLLAGIHDGPTTGLCATSSLTPYFFNTNISNCQVRDNAVTNLASTETGTTNCLDPAQNGTQECLNTFANDTVRSGMPIINTLAPDGVDPAVWTQTITNAFMINATTGSAGHGSERAFSSVLEFLKVNEATGSASAFFRPGSLRGVFFLGDEDDQSTDLDADTTQITNPFADYMCDQAQLDALNPGNVANINSGYCCSGGGCQFGTRGTSCPVKSIDNGTWTISTCPDPSLLMPVSSVKTRLDTFFQTLDAAAPTDPSSYFVATIVPQSLQTLQTIQALREQDDTEVGTYLNQSVDRGDRYLALVSAVGNGSLALELGSPSYDTLLDQIGTTIVQKKGTFQLARAPTGFEDMVVSILHIDGSTTVIDSSKLAIVGTTVQITDLQTVLTLKGTDKISINYQPKTAF